VAKAKKPATTSSKASQASKPKTTRTSAAEQQKIKSQAADDKASETPSSTDLVSTEASAPKPSVPDATTVSPKPATAPQSNFSSASASEAKASPPKSSDPVTGAKGPDATKTGSDKDSLKDDKTTPADTSKVATGSVDKPSDKPAQKPDAIPPKNATLLSSSPAQNASRTPPVAQTKRRSVFWPLLLGGMLAAGIGFFAAEMDLLNMRGDNPTLQAALDRQQQEIDALRETQSTSPVIGDAPAPPAPVEFPALDELTAQVASISESLTGLQARLDDVEQRPVAAPEGSGMDGAAFEEELTALKSSIEAQRAEIEALLDNAQTVEEATAIAARQAATQAALTRIDVAVNTGQPFASALADLQSSGVDDIPPALGDLADSGVATLNNLQTRFPENARAALDAARVNAPEARETGFSGFLRRQLGARSVAPREGTDPDAVLSRTEAAVRDGRLTDALAEIDTLPDVAKDAMQDWLTDARARQAAQEASDTLSQRLTAN